jgi:hypothetical protein
MTTPPPNKDRDPDPGNTLPALPQDEELSDPGDLSEEIPPDEEGDLLDDRAQDETLTPSELGIDDGADEAGWTDDSEGDERGEAEDVGDLGSEYGWTNDSDEPGTGDWDEDLGAGPEDGPSVLEDGGDEGAAEEADLDDLSFEPLEHEDDNEEGDGRGEEELGDDLGDERHELPPHHDESRILLRAVGPAEGTLVVLVGRSGGGLLAGGEGLYSADESGVLSAVDEGPLEAEAVTSIAVEAARPDDIAVGTMLGGVFVSRDGGETFTPVNGWRQEARRGAASGWVVYAGSTLVLRTADGDLFRSADHGESWSIVTLPGRALAHAATPTGVLAVLCASPEGPVVVTSSDAGQSQRVGPPVPDLRPIAACTDVQLGVGPDLLVVGAEDETRGAWASHDGGETFHLWARTPGVTAIAAHPTLAGVCMVAICLPGENRAAVLRTADAGQTFTTLFELGTLRTLLHLDTHGDEEGENRVSGLAWGPAWTSLLVATSAGGFFVQVRDDEPLPGSSVSPS